ncbi:thioredoxin-disulfide reductase [Acidisphaera sp. L21]|jgi:thioredoxin reductase (NADPH)|uniref:thioredoxin-disulfide reductase n=1 Tax=Acidisphaera sp. L21 TaxID=1641851 RepID=UPI00131B2DDE|nr:thioredoxin-disulfide reductase [Acidisphaera sp. L21]
MPQTIHSRVLILGGGPAGYTAAIYAARASLSPVLIQGMQPGGQLTITTEVENYPGFAEAIQGPWLMEQMEAQAQHVGTRIVGDVIVELDLSARPFRALGDSGDTYTADSVVLATGAQARWLGLPSEKLFSGAGVSACATCDGFFFRGKPVAVIGGGNTAVEEALYLTNHASSVTVIHRRDSFRAERILQDRLFANPKVRVVWNSAVEEILGSTAPKSVEGVRVRDRAGAMQDIPVEGVFVAIGHDPATSLVRGQLDLDESGYVRIAAWSTATNVPGVFAAGDVADPRYRQAVTAAGMGCMAALEAEKFLAEHSPLPSIRAREAHTTQMIGAWD